MIEELILASGSPRRKAFFKEMGFDFRVEKYPVDEDYPTSLKGEEIALYLAEKKTQPFLKRIQDNQLVITADTIVWHKGQCLGKPENKNEAYAMLKQLSGTTHEVITAVGFLTKAQFEVLHKVSKVRFKTLTESEIEAYIATQQPYDKAGGYGIQDAFGKAAVVNIQGSYTNVVGLPVEACRKKINEILKRH